MTSPDTGDNVVYVLLLWGRPFGDVYQHRGEALAEFESLRNALADPDDVSLLACTPVRPLRYDPTGPIPFPK